MPYGLEAIDRLVRSDTLRRGELSEWSKVLDSKSSVPPKGTAGSNPALSAKGCAATQAKLRFVGVVSSVIGHPRDPQCGSDWRGDRAVEGARLEIVCAGNGTAGSNPALSAGTPCMLKRSWVWLNPHPACGPANAGS